MTTTMPAQAMPAPKLKRHPIRGFFWGLIAGFGLALILVNFAVIALGTLTPWVITLVVALLGVVWGLLGPARTKGALPAMAVPSTPPSPGPPPAAQTPPAPIPPAPAPAAQPPATPQAPPPAAEPPGPSPTA